MEDEQLKFDRPVHIDPRLGRCEDPKPGKGKFVPSTVMVDSWKHLHCLIGNLINIMIFFPRRPVGIPSYYWSDPYEPCAELYKVFERKCADLLALKFVR